MLTDDNPQRLAEVMATVDEALIMQGKGIGHEEIINMFKKTKPTKHATGGRVPMFAGGAARKLWQEFIERQFLKASNDIRQEKENGKV